MRNNFKPGDVITERDEVMRDWSNRRIFRVLRTYIQCDSRMIEGEQLYEHEIGIQNFRSDDYRLATDKDTAAVVAYKLLGVDPWKKEPFYRDSSGCLRMKL